MSRFREFDSPSPNWARSPANERLGVVLHHSGLSFADTIALMADPASAVSYHALVDTDGTRCRMVPDAGVAWHAGASVFRGRPRCNDFMLGLAFAGDTYAAPLTAAQIGSAVEWIGLRRGPLGWTGACVTDHRQVSPGRKADLNPDEWARVAAALDAAFGR